MDRTLQTIQSNNLRNVNEKLNEEKYQWLSEMFNQKEIELNSIINHFEESLKKLSKDFSDFEAEIEKKYKKLNESVKQNAMKSPETDLKIEMIKTDSLQNSTSLNEDINKTGQKNFQETVTTIDDQSEIVKGLKAATIDQSTKVNKLEDEIKDIKSRLGVLMFDFHEEKISSYITTQSPVITWRTNGINKMIQEKSQLISQSIQLIGYQQKAQVKISICSSNVDIDLIFEEGDFKLLKLKPSVHNQRLQFVVSLLISACG
ncbi:hypothetical protein CHUAL_010746 [Chamberlinius hualienensis]